MGRVLRRGGGGAEDEYKEKGRKGRALRVGGGRKMNTRREEREEL